MLPPIGVFAYKRSAHLKACLDAISQSEKLLGKKLPLYIFCDYPKSPEDHKQVEQTLQVARAHVGATVVAREKNFGFRNITEGVSALCKEHGQAIIIEDDVLIAPDFLPFMCRALKAYEADPRVFMISGFMYYGMEQSAPFFLNQSYIWGWATWQRAWEHYSWEAEGWETVRQNKKQRHLFDCYGAHPFSKGLEKTMTGQWKAWAPQWHYAMFKANGLALYPARSLVWNSGCGGGTHGNSKLDANPTLGEREHYIHGDLQYADFQKPRLQNPIESWPEPRLNRQAMKQLAVIFLDERLRRNERKRWRLKVKKWMNQLPTLQQSPQ